MDSEMVVGAVGDLGSGSVELKLKDLEKRYQDIITRAVNHPDGDTILQPIACNAELYHIVDKVTKWALSSNKTPLAFDARDLPFDINEACGLLTGIDEGTQWRELATNLYRIAAFWSAMRWTSDEARKEQAGNEMCNAIEAAFGFTISISGGDESKRTRALRQLRERLERDEREVRLTMAAIAALESAPPEEAAK